MIIIYKVFKLLIVILMHATLYQNYFYEQFIFSLDPMRPCKYFNLFSYILSIFFVTVRQATITK